MCRTKRNLGLDEAANWPRRRSSAAADRRSALFEGDESRGRGGVTGPRRNGHRHHVVPRPGLWPWPSLSPGRGGALRPHGKGRLRHQPPGDPRPPPGGGRSGGRPHRSRRQAGGRGDGTAASRVGAGLSYRDAQWSKDRSRDRSSRTSRRSADTGETPDGIRRAAGGGDLRPAPVCVRRHGSRAVTQGLVLSRHFGQGRRLQALPQRFACRRPHPVQGAHLVPVARSAAERALTGIERSLERLDDLAHGDRLGRPCRARSRPWDPTST